MEDTVQAKLLRWAQKLLETLKTLSGGLERVNILAERETSIDFADVRVLLAVELWAACETAATFVKIRP